MGSQSGIWTLLNNNPALSQTVPGDMVLQLLSRGTQSTAMAALEEQKPVTPGSPPPLQFPGKALACPSLGSAPRPAPREHHGGGSWCSPPEMVSPVPGKGHSPGEMLIWTLEKVFKDGFEEAN